MSAEIVTCDVAAGIATVTLNRPEALNALSDKMLSRLHATLTRLATDDKVRVILLRGAGRGFCAGHDLREMQAGRAADDGGAAYFADLFDRCAALMQLIPTLPQPVIAQVHGIATAAGCQLVASCDMAVAGQSARFGVNGVNIGLFCSTPMVALTRNIPRKAAFEMLTTGAFVPAQKACELGLINRVVPDARLGVETLALARDIAEKLDTAVRIGKRIFYAQAELGLTDAYALAGRAMVENMLDASTSEGISAFLDKRKPDWSQE